MGDDEARTELLIRELESRLLRALQEEGDWRRALFAHAPTLLRPLGADGAVLHCDGETIALGRVPDEDAVRLLLDWLAVAMRESVHASAWPFTAIDASVAGDPPDALLAIGLSRAAEYLVWFRNGDATWSDAEVATAAAMRSSLSDLITQVRAMRMLLTHQRMVESRDLVQAAEEPVVILDATGRCLVVNGAFQSLLGRAAELDSIEDVPALFTEPHRLAALIEAARSGRRPWQGALELRTGAKAGRPVTVRLDPIPRPEGGVLGIILVLTDSASRAMVRRRWNGTPLEPSADAPAPRATSAAAGRPRERLRSPLQALAGAAEALASLGSVTRRVLGVRLRFGRSQ